MLNDWLYILQTALDQAREGITICDALQPDYPLVYVNKGFLQMTGYDYEEVIGRNARFLQGKDTDHQTVGALHQAITQQQAYEVVLLNYHRSGKPFWNKLLVTPVFNSDKKLTHYIGLQEDITVQKDNSSFEQKVIQQKLITQISLQAQEKERDEIGKELHDNINQLLATCKLYLHIAASDKSVRLNMIQQTETLLNTTIEEIRKLSKALVGPHFDEISLNESVADLVDSLRVAVPFTIQYDCQRLQEEKLSETKKLILFRIVQEQLNNIVKHAHANAVSILLDQCHEYVRLIIKDDGVGFDTSSNYKGIGLKNINSRVAIENGTVEVNSREGEGCEMKIILPL